MALCPELQHLATRPTGEPHEMAGIATATCTAETSTGGPCGHDAVPDVPFPICVEHLLTAYRHVARLMADDPQRSRRLLHVAAQGVGRGRNFGSAPITMHEDVMNGWESVVYYIECGGHIKIGHSQRMFERMRSYPPSARVLALEPGFFAMERRRQRQFKSLLAARIEWFHPGDELMDHIASLAVQGLPLGPLLTGVPAPAELTT